MTMVKRREEEEEENFWVLSGDAYAEPLKWFDSVRALYPRTITITWPSNRIILN